MEKDFMGLRTVRVKQEVLEESSDSAPVRGSTMRWSFSNKVAGNSQYFTFDGAGAGAGAKDDKPKTGFEALASTGLVTITTTEAADSGQKAYSAVLQKNMVLDNPWGTHNTVASYPARPFDVQSLHRPRVARVLPLPTPENQTVSLTMSNPVHQSFISPAGMNLIGSTTPQPLSVTSWVPGVRSANPVVGTTELRGTSKTSGAPAQLSIFYAGSVCVYDDISPEKAQAIMLLAGNAPPPPTASILAVPAVPVQAVQLVSTPVVRPSIVDSFVANHSSSPKPCIPSPISMARHSPAVSVVPNDVVRTMRGLVSPSNKAPKQASSLGSAPARASQSAAVPQFRKASLARFLEKRKERTLSASPYAAEERPQECGSLAAASGS